MKQWLTTTVFAIVLVCLVETSHAQASRSDGQAASGDKPNFTGSWVLNQDLGDTSPQARFRGDGSGTREGQRREGRRGGGFGGGFGGRGRFGNGGAGGRQSTQDASERREKIEALRDEMRYPSSSLLISHSGSNLAITDAQDHTRIFQIGGKKDAHQLGSGTVDSTTRWDGNRLVTEYDLGNGRRLRYTYSIVQNTGQLLEQVAFDGGQEQSGRGTRSVKRVYDAAPVKRAPKPQ